MKQDNRDNSKNWQTTNTGGTNYTGEIHFHGSESNSPLTRQEYRNRQALLNKVKNFWVKGVLEKSLYNQVLIELGLEERFDAVNSSWNLELETAGEGQKPLPKGTKVISIFDQLGEGRTLLILGEPGAGKTTALLELTRDLITRTESSLNYRIPVVLNLSSWAGKKQSIADWLVEELKSKYQIPKPIGLDWVKKQELLLLLDGLDEVKAEHRDSCVAALNDFQQNYAAEMVVCSRIKDYKKLSNRLRFQKAIYLRSLTPEQVCQYLDNIKADLTGLRALIEEDTALQELAKSPLMLSIMVLAYEGVTAEDLPNTDVVEERRKQLFDAYITRMFHRPTRLKVEQRYSETQSIRWLTWLAQRMVQESQTVFLIEGMQPTWLPTNYTKYKKILYQLVIFLISGLIFGLIEGLIWRLFSGIMEGLISVPIFGLIFGLINAWNNLEIKTVETLKWSWEKAKSSLISAVIIGLICGLIFGLICGLIVVILGLGNGLSNKLIFRLFFGLVSGLFTGLFFGLVGGLFFGLVGGLVGGMKGSEIATKTIPNQGIYRTAMNSGIMGLIIGVLMGLIIGVLMGLFSGLIPGLIMGLIPGLNFGLIAAIVGGGKACIQHLTLRLILYAHGCIPWNYARFLDYATERIFLQKVGGGYIFIHRLLLEHFAQMKLDQLDNRPL